MTPRARQLFLIATVVAIAIPLAVYVYVRPDLKRVSELLSTSKTYPSNVTRAVLLAEDPVFLKRSRFDTAQSTMAIVSSVARETFGRRVVIVDAPASLTQRLVRWNVNGAHLSRTLKTMIVAAVVDATVSKQAVLNAYMHHVYLGRNGAHQIYGIEEAAESYFGLAPEQLTVAQIVSLVSAIRSPSVLSPRSVSETAVRRRLRLLDEMQRTRAISANDYAVARDTLRRGDA